MNFQIITPYVNDSEINEHKQLFWELDVYYEKDEAGIGSDLMFQRMWNKFPDKDIFILHADMTPYYDNWFSDFLTYVKRYPKAGMFGGLLLYPGQTKDKKHYIQSAGGKFTNNRPDHFGSGLILENKTKFKEHLEVDEGQYDNVREVAWTTFGGCYLRRSFINTVGGFDPGYEWTYNRDVDFCLKARAAGQKIYQIPVRLFHHESKDNKIIKAKNPSLVAMEQRNLERLQNIWSTSQLYKTIDRIVE